MWATRENLALDHIRFGGRIAYYPNARIDALDANDYLLDCCDAGKLHTGCLKGRIENYVVNGGGWTPGPSIGTGTGHWCKLCGKEHRNPEAEKACLDVTDQHFDKRRSTNVAYVRFIRQGAFW
jgi:hypothetical protein